MDIKNILISHKDSIDIAIINGSKKRTYKELYDDVENSVYILHEKLKLSKSIGVFIHNSIDYVIAYFTVAFLDRVIVPINTRVKKKELVGTIEYCELEVIITDNKNIKILHQCLQDYMYRILVYNIETKEFEYMGNENEFTISEENNELNDVALMLHTSGSLSSPKRVMLTHKNLISCVESIIKSLRITQNDRTLIALPMFLASANTSQLLAHLYLGASMVIMDSLFSSGYFFKLVETHKVTNFTGVPYMMLNLLESNNKKGYDISSLRYICFGGAPTPAKKIEHLVDTFKNIEFVQMYGQTEASTRISHMLLKENENKIASVGKPIPGMIWKLVDDNGKELKNGQAGEIIVKGNNVMKGYYKRKELTEVTLKDGWLYTGDIGKLDEEGFMYIVGRKRNVIIKGGMNIYPEEIEEVLLLHEAVKEVCVTCEEDELLGEVPVANIVLKDVFSNLNIEELKSYCSKNISSYKIPDEFRLVERLDKTDSGKIKRK